MNIEAMKLWLKALETSWYHVGTFCPTDAAIELYDEARDSLRQAIEQAQKQEPVAYDKTELNRFAQDLYDQKMREGKHGHYESMFHVIHQCIKRVAPPQRQPLTDEEIRKAKHHMVEGAYHYSFQQGVRYAEAAHGIKGEA